MPTEAGDNTSDILVETLIAWGATHVFGIVGDGINPVTEALRNRSDRIAFIGVRHEEAAAFMATAYAKHSGGLGVCLATTGPGAVHLLNGLYDAAYDNVHAAQSCRDGMFHCDWHRLAPGPGHRRRHLRAAMGSCVAVWPRDCQRRRFGMHGVQGTRSPPCGSSRQQPRWPTSRCHSPWPWAV
jgi:hypothetical protein